MSALLSVVVTTFNREKTIKRTIDSILAQTYNNFELIIVDDCSNDNTVSIIKNYDDKRIKLFQNEVNLGVVRNKGNAYKYITGNFFVYMDSDDYYVDTTFFERALKEFEHNNQLNMFLSKSKIIVGKNYETNITDLRFAGYLSSKDYLNEFLKKYNRAIQGDMVIRKSIVDDTKICELGMLDDIVMVLAGIGNDGLVYGEDNVVMAYEQQSNSVSVNIKNELIICHIKAMKSLYDYYVANNVLEDKEKWLTYQIKVLISFYMSSPSANLGHINCIIKLLFENNIPNKFSLIKSMILDYVYIKNKNHKGN